MKITRIIMICCLSFVCGHFIGNIIHSPTTAVDLHQYLATLQSPGEAYFFRHNISYFLVVSVLPFINIIILMIQMVSTGIQSAFIVDFSWQQQVTLLYRHLVLEMIALCSAIFVSYKIYYLLKKLHRKDLENLQEVIVPIAKIYVLIFICTVIGAILEGGIRV